MRAVPIRSLAVVRSTACFFSPSTISDLSLSPVPSSFHISGARWCFQEACQLWVSEVSSSGFIIARFMYTECCLGPALGTYASPPPRQIDLDPKSARTVVHEVYARRRAPSGENDGQGAIPPRLRVSPYDEDEELDRKSGLLPRGTVAQRRRSAIEGGSK